MKLEVYYIEEPELILGGNRKAIDPKTGLLTFGPYYLPEEKKPRPSEIRIGIVGNGDTIAKTKMWIEKCKGYIEGKSENPYLYPSFPGFSKVFNCEFILSKSLTEKINEREIKDIIEEPDINKRIFKAVDLFLRKIEILCQREPKPDVIICALPKDIDEYCGISEKTRGAKKLKRLQKVPREQKTLLDFLDGVEESSSIDLSYDFRRALKGRSMKFGVPIQILRYRTLSNDPRLEDEATRAWNFCLALYYKAGGLPWRLAEIDPHTCYVGISFFKEKLSGEENLRVSLAQVFTVSGESLVLRGDKAEIDITDRQPHLTEESAYSLLKNAIELFETHVKTRPNRVVVHKTSRYTDEELKGFKKAVEDINSATFVAFGTNERNIKFVREGKYPPLRGTLFKLSDNTLLLYTVGFVPYLGTYPGPRIPSPLEILEIHGDDDMIQIAKEVLALTKLNWNSTKFFSREPITIKFSREVGKILSELPPDHPIQTQYRFYM